MNRELAEAKERLARLELKDALAGFDPVAEMHLGRSAPSLAGQSPTNSLQIEKAIKSVETARRAEEARAKQTAVSHEQAVRMLQAGQSPDNMALIRASTTTLGEAATVIPGPSR